MWYCRKIRANNLLFFLECAIIVLNCFSNKRKRCTDCLCRHRAAEWRVVMETRDYYRTIADIALESLVFFDEKGNIQGMNQQARSELGFKEGEFPSKKIYQILPGIVEEEEDGRVKINVPCGVKQIQESIYRSNSTCFPADLRIEKICDDPVCYVCLSINVKERQGALRDLDRSKRDAREAEKTRDEFVANVTHELRTPVNGILGHVKNLIDMEDRPEQLKAMRIIERCCQDMHKLIDNILDFSKLQADKFTLEEREFDFREMMHHVENIHSPKANEAGISLQITVNDNVPDRIVGDELRITQVLNNLISNAIKFTAVGKVAVEVIKTLQSRNEVELFFLVIDSGIGISPEEKDKLFKNFSQVDASITRRYGGTGLGLAVCKELVELMRGSINVESEKGNGSMFSFSIMVKLPESSETGRAGAAGAEVSVEDIKESAYTRAGFGKADAIARYGTPENQKAVRDTMEKLVLCLEMDNWEKAEKFAASLKSLLQNAGEEKLRLLLRLEMAIRKESYDKAMKAYGMMKDSFSGGTGG